jgi:hypothetical protein
MQFDRDWMNVRVKIAACAFAATEASRGIDDWDDPSPQNLAGSETRILKARSTIPGIGQHVPQ